MNNTVFPRSSGNSQGWSLNELVEQEPTRRRGLMRWWYAQTAMPAPPANASFVQREAAWKSHLLSTIVFWLLVVFILFIPACFALPNPYVIWADVGMIAVCVIAILCNRYQQPQIAGLLLTGAFELALTMVIFTTLPLDEPSIQQWDLFVFGEILCVSLLAPGSVFLVMVYNIAIITVSLFLQSHTAILVHDLQTQWAPILVRPVGIQMLVAVGTYLWVRNANQAIKRADRAETVAKLEHQLAKQKQELEDGVRELLETHVAIANNNLNARAPLRQDNMLWQIARALNNLLVRFQRADREAKQFRSVQEAVQSHVSAIQRAEQLHQEPVFLMTQTALDPLIVAFRSQHLRSAQANRASSQHID
jgi:hypothetical protein